MEPAVQAAVRARIGGTLPPWPAHGAEADVVGNVVCEDTLGYEPRWPVSEIRPVPPARAANQTGITIIIAVVKERKCFWFWRHVPAAVVIRRVDEP
jgi:hypothetical protein